MGTAAISRVKERLAVGCGMQRYLSRLVGAVAVWHLLIPSALALDPHKRLTQYNLDAWTHDDGLPYNAVLKIIQTRDGYLWLGTVEGLVRFDGVRFKVFDKNNAPALRHNQISDLFEDSTGTLWIGTHGAGLVRYADGAFSSFPKKDSLSTEVVRAVLQTRDGNLWIGTTGGGLTRVKGDTRSAFTTREGLSDDRVLCLYEDHTGALWVGTINGLNKIVDGHVTAYGAKDGLPFPVARSVAEMPDGSLWIGSTGGGVSRWKDSKFTVFGTRDGLPDDNVRAVYRDRQNVLWLGTDHGIARWEGDHFSTYSSQDGLVGDVVFTLFEDHEGSLWVGTYGGGLSRFRDGKFLVYTTREGLPNDRTKSIVEDRDGDLWVSTNGGVARRHAGAWTAVTVKDGLADDRVRPLLADSRGHLWIGTDKGLDVFHEGRLTAYEPHDGLPQGAIESLFEDRDGAIWIGGAGGGAARLKDGAAALFTTHDGLTSNNVRAFAQSRDGTVWIGTEGGGGLSRYRDGHVEPERIAGGLPNDLVFALHVDAQDSLWIGTYGGGLVRRLPDGRLRVYNTRRGLFDDVVYQIVDDGLGRFWMSCNRGIFYVRKQDLDDLDAGRITGITSVAFDTSDGMKTSECYGGAQPGALLARDHRIWFPTNQGVVAIDPANLKVNRTPPMVRIEAVTVDGRPLDVRRQTVDVPPGEGDVTIEYTALSFIGPHKMRFQYQLEGLDHEWIDAQSRRTAYYTNLPPARYRFRVKAANSDGTWNERGAEFAFRLKPHFYQSRWIYAAAATVLLLAGTGAYRYRVAELTAHDQELGRRVDERTQQLQREIAERTRAEQELLREVAERQRTEEALRESEERYRRLVEISPDAIAVQSGDRIVYINRAGAELLGGLEPDALVGRRLREFLKGDDPHRVPTLSGLPVEHKLMRADGAVRDVEVVAIPFIHQKERAVQLVIRDITERKQAETQIKNLAYHDTLTGLPNRRLFDDRLAIAVAYAHRHQQWLALLFLDLDRFKSINDSFGHAFGDKLLCALGQRLQSAVREGDTVARLAGDEFTLLLPSVQRVDVAKVADKILDTLRRPLQIQGRQVSVTTSMGVSLYPEDAENAETLMRHADVAMYRAKHAGRNRYCFYRNEPEG